MKKSYARKSGHCSRKSRSGDTGANVGRSYWKDLCLIIVGGLLSMIPVLVSTHLQNEAHSRDLLADRRLSAIRDYSRAISKMAAEIEKACDEYGGQVDNMQSQYEKGKVTRLEVERRLTPYFYRMNQAATQGSAEVNACGVIVNILFGKSVDIPALPSFEISGCVDPMVEGSWKRSYSEYLSQLHKDATEMKDTFFVRANKQHQELSKLLNTTRVSEGLTGH